MPNPPQATLITPAYLRLLAIQMAFGMSYSAFLLLPKYLRVELQASASEIGWVGGIALIAAAALSPFVGFSARFVSRKTLLLAGLLLEGCAALGFALTDSLGPVVLALRVLQGLAWVIVFNCTATMVVESVPSHRMAQAIGYLGVAMLSTNALAPALTEPLARHLGWGLAFGLPAVVVLAAAFLVPGLPAPSNSNSSSTSSSTSGTAASPASLACYYVSFLMGGGIGVMFTFTQPFALAQGASQVGSFFFGYVAAAVFVRVALARVADRVGTARVAMAAISTYGVVVGCTAGLTPALLVPLGAGLGFSHGFLYPALTATGLAPLSAKGRSVFMGWFACSFNSGYAVTATSLGEVADQRGYPIVFVIAGLLIGTGALPLVLTSQSRRQAMVRVDPA